MADRSTYKYHLKQDDKVIPVPDTTKIRIDIDVRNGILHGDLTEAFHNEQMIDAIHDSLKQVWQGDEFDYEVKVVN